MSCIKTNRTSGNAQISTKWEMEITDEQRNKIRKAVQDYIAFWAK